MKTGYLRRLRYHKMFNKKKKKDKNDNFILSFYKKTLILTLVFSKFQYIKSNLIDGKFGKEIRGYNKNTLHQTHL